MCFVAFHISDWMSRYAKLFCQIQMSFVSEYNTNDCELKPFFVPRTES